MATLLDAVGDILHDRAATPTPPSWSEERGWTAFLRGLDDATLEVCEARGPEHVLADRADAPPSLRALAEEARSVAALRALAPATGAAVAKASPKKRDQIEALAALAPRGARRVVDFGAGRGHLTRRLAAELGVDAVGFERREAVVRAARAIAPDPRVAFEARELDADVDVDGGDLLVGLHACGALGDLLIEAAATTGAAVLLVPCCPQKIPGEVRAPLSAAGRELSREVLGLANLAHATEAGTSVREAARRRLARHGLRLLLAEAGVETRPGEESLGINRKQFRRSLAEVAARGFGARGLPLPTEDAIRRAEARAAEEQALMRRFALPRTMLARPLEMAVVLDRAAALEAGRGPAPEVLVAFPASVSPRNLVIRRACDQGR